MSSQLAAFGSDDWLPAAIGAIFLVVGVWVMPRVWRDELALGGEHAPEWWPWGEALWQGYRRVPPIGLAFVVVGLMIGLAGAFVPEQATEPFARPYWFIVPALVALGLVFAATLGVVFFNRPKFIVPPHLRDHPGAIAAWLGDWRRFRTKRRSRAEGRTRDVRR